MQLSSSDVTREERKNVQSSEIPRWYWSWRLTSSCDLYLLISGAQFETSQNMLEANIKNEPIVV